MSHRVRSLLAALVLAPLLGGNVGPESEDTAPVPEANSVHAMGPPCEYSGVWYPDGSVYGSANGTNR